jgi:hypothetical protein
MLPGLCVALAASAWLVAAADRDAPGDADVIAWVAKTVAERQPPEQDKRFDEIGWVTDLRSAIELGKIHRRPIFLFTMDGRINIGRC